MHMFLLFMLLICSEVDSVTEAVEVTQTILLPIKYH